MITFSDDEVYEAKENEEQKQDVGQAEYERVVVNVGGLKINLQSDNLDILKKSASSLSDFFYHYIPSTAAMSRTV